ncbi:hypothetical protein [Streptomyces zaomyceticus]|uniref:hypothetical protein n=1 Tax=Streptomyces zaomyceticus TaxID=68286 RepID=UPI00343556C0
MGHLALQFAAKLGYETIAIAGSEGHEQIARELGAHRARSPLRSHHALAPMTEDFTKVVREATAGRGINFAGIGAARAESSAAFGPGVGHRRRQHRLLLQCAADPGTLRTRAGA